MKKNNKGFVLAEAIIVSVFVLGMFTYLAMNVIPLISRYERVVNYDNPQEIYLANTLYEEMVELETSKNVQSSITMSINNNDCESIKNDKGLKNYCEYYIKRKDKDGNPKTITKAFMIKFSGDKENNSNKAVNKKYATIVVSQ